MNWRDIENSDSIDAAVDTTDSTVTNGRHESSASSGYHGHSSYDDYDYEDDDDDDEPKSKYANDGHPGTKPDDGLFGFDPYDDEDDAYHVERNQVDPYPDEW